MPVPRSATESHAFFWPHRSRMTLLPYTGANVNSFCATENSQPVQSLVFDVPRVTLSTLKLALFYDLATDKDGDLPAKPEKSERALLNLMRRCDKPIALFVD